MNTLEKLHEIESKKCVYNIHYCRAGVGFCFYYPDKDPTPDGADWRNEDWRKALSVDKYYPTFQEAVDGEYLKLT